MNAAKRLAKALLKANREEKRPWRKISLEDFGGRVSAGTLNRFAKSGGAWLPKDRRILKSMGLIGSPARDLFDMSTEALRDAIINRQGMSNPPDPRIIEQFVRLGWLEKARRANQ